MASMIEDLLRPENLPDPTQSVRLVQTHISLVFVGDRFVYKVKKPVDFGFLDFSTLDKRKYYCQKEIELNSRLTKDIYIDLLCVTRNNQGFKIEASPRGDIVDYAVKMRRIPEEGLMKNLFAKGTLTNRHLRRLAGVLADFHSRAATNSEIQEFGRPERFKVNTDENFQQVEPYVGITIDKKAFSTIKRWTDSFYKRHEPIFHKRIEQGKVKDGHGDLHMEHICFEKEQISIFDCIEFNDRFRYADQLADISFLLMDLDFHGGAEHARFLWNCYKDLASEEEVEDLLTFYKVYRAFVRGKVTSFQLDDQHISGVEKDKAAHIARKYFALALEYVTQ